MKKRRRYGSRVIGGMLLSLALAGAVSMAGGTVAFANYDPKEAEEEEPVQVVTEETPEISESKPFSVAGNGEVLDDISDDETKQFITVRTKNNQTFFVVIDRANSVDNVYMLSMIDENDLAEFLEDGEEDGAVLPAVQLPQDNAVAVDENGNPIPSGEEVNAGNEKKPGGSTGMLLIAVGVVAAFAGGYYYFKIYKPKQQNGGSSAMPDQNGRQSFDVDSEYDEEDFADDDDGELDDDDYSVESEDLATDTDAEDEDSETAESGGESGEDMEMTAGDNTEDYYDEDDEVVEETPKRSTRRRRRRKKSEE